MAAGLLPEFDPVQDNVSLNALGDSTRGIHAELWDKFVILLSRRLIGHRGGGLQGSTSAGDDTSGGL